MTQLQVDTEMEEEEEQEEGGEGRERKAEEDEGGWRVCVIEHARKWTARLLVCMHACTQAEHGLLVAGMITVMITTTVSVMSSSACGDDYNACKYSFRTWSEPFVACHEHRIKHSLVQETVPHPL